MKILVDSSNYFHDNRNYGDIAMFRMVSHRLLRLWPGAEVNLITLDPELIATEVPGVRPLRLNARHGWELFPPAASSPGSEWRWRRRMRRWRALAGIQNKLPGYAGLSAETPDVDRFIDMFREASLVMANGGGYFSDMFPEHARGILDTLAGAMHFGVATAIMGAGFEDVRNPALCAKARAVLPHLDLITCREGLHAPRILQDFGVSPNRIRVAGDEAIAISHEARASQLGSGLGINLRCAEYSGVSEEELAVIAPIITRAAEKHSAPLLPIPISMFGPSDCESIRVLLARHDPDSDGGASLDTLPKLLEQVSRCRVVVTGSYHAAVFALSQGISVVAVIRSLHYATKLDGLRAQFEEGCKLIMLDTPDFVACLSDAIDDSWAVAGHVRETLLAQASEQIRRCDEAYLHLGEIVG